jgi:hypothetical protein
MVVAAVSEETRKHLRTIGLVATEVVERPLPPYPTMALPGSAEKIEVMMWRQKRGYHLYHPLDAKFSDDPRIVFRQMVRDFDNTPIHPNDPPPDLRTIVQKARAGAVDSAGWQVEGMEV